MTQQKLIERIKAGPYSDLDKALIIGAIVSFWQEGRTMPNISLAGLLHCAAKVTGVKVSDLKSRKRDKEFIRGRHLYCYYAHTHYKEYSLKKTGEVIDRDHTSVIHSITTYTNLLHTEDELSQRDYENMDKYVHTGELNVYVVPKEEPLPRIKSGRVVINLETEDEYKSIVHAAKSINISPKTFGWRLKNQKKFPYKVLERQKF